MSTPYPLGVRWDGSGVNVAIASSVATAVSFCRFADPDDPLEAERIPLRERSGDVWHDYLPGIRPGDAYGFRVDGPWDPERGLRCNPAKLLTDPYAFAIHRGVTWSPAIFAHRTEPRVNDLIMNEQDSAPFVPRSVVVDPAYDWGTDSRLAIPMHESVILELHVKGFTKTCPDIPEELRGTYAGLAHPAAISYLQQLGVTAVELLPVHAHEDETHLASRGLTNYWGYNTLAFLAPSPRLAAATAGNDQVREFKDMVKALHAAGIEVLLDVVYNHTAEGNHLGPCLGFRGIDNAAYYRLDPDHPRFYLDYTGCGNTFDTTHPVGLALVMDSLRHWVEEMHVDGFRFDLAPALLREANEVAHTGAFLDTISQDPVLHQVKLIAEPWDTGNGGYHLGNFPGGWSEWNDRYRDTLRSFWRGDPQGTELGFRIAGSPDLFRRGHRLPSASINFITAHDGFTMLDLSSYLDKHNEANGEADRDGSNHNLSFNWGVEGPSARPDVVAIRHRQQRNMLTTLLCSLGVPMLLGGDEIHRTQRGNNNAYCQDNAISWWNWDLDEGAETTLALTRRLVHLRRTLAPLRRVHFADHRDADNPDHGLVWLRPGGGEMQGDDWQRGDLRALGWAISAEAPETGWLALLMNASGHAVPFDLPDGRAWAVMVDTTAPLDDTPKPVPTATLTVPPHAVMVLIAD